jgi:hypothetical protein
LAKQQLNNGHIPNNKSLQIEMPDSPISPKSRAITIKQRALNMQAEEVINFQQRIAVWQEDPVLFVKEAIGVGICDCGCKISSQQKKVMRDVAKLVRVKEKLWIKEVLTPEEELFSDKIGLAIKAGKGTGKTTVMAWIYEWLLVCFGYRQKHMVTAPRKEALRDNIFAEISLWITHSKNVYGENSILGNLLCQDAIKVYLRSIYDTKGNLDKDATGKQGFLVGRTCSRNASESDQKATLQGYHEVYQMLGADEGFGVPNAVFEPLETTCTREVNFMFLIGNPTKNSGFMFDTFGKNRHWWITHTMNAEESDIVSKDHVARMKEKYKDYPNLYRVNILGEFPLDGDGQLIPYNKIMEAVELYKDLKERDFDDPRIKGHPVFLGFDIGAGLDPSVCYRRQGILLERVGSRLISADTHHIERWAAGIIESERPKKAGVDGLTWGKGVYDNLSRNGYRDIVHFVDARRKPGDDRHKNLRAKLHMAMADVFIQGNIAIPDDDELIGQLSVLRTVDGADKIQIISKKTMRSEGVDSPNDSDASTFTFFFSDSRFMENGGDGESEPVSGYDMDKMMRNNGKNKSWMGA